MFFFFVTVRLPAISCPEIFCPQMFCTLLRPFIPNKFSRLVLVYRKKYDFPLEYVKCGVGFTLVLKKIKKIKNDKKKKATATLHEKRIS